MIADRCYHCGRKIYLVRVGRGHRWVENPKSPDQWNNCKGAFILNSPHAPKELFYAENRNREISQDDSKQQGSDKAPETKSQTLHDLRSEKGEGWQV